MSMFQPGQIVKHVKTGKRYLIMRGPRNTRLQATNIPAYVCEALIGEDGWARSQEEMEDGRFVAEPLATTDHRTD
jgi:hypothetical protein